MNLKLDAIAQPLQDQHFLLSGVTWEQYDILRSTLDSPGLRITYLEGLLELFMPSEEHEAIKKTIARILELYALESNIRLYGFGSATYRKQAKERGLEPDECYYLDTKKEFPDIAIEVVITSGLIDKLAVYAGLSVPEVWVWQNDQLRLYHLRQTGYEQIFISEFLPNLDLELLCRCIRMNDQHDAVLAFRSELKS